jgi:arylsulfatase
MRLLMLASLTAGVALGYLSRRRPVRASRHESGSYERWFIDPMFLMVPAQAYVAQHLTTYREFPPRQKPGTFALDQVLEKLYQAGGGNK